MLLASLVTGCDTVAQPGLVNEQVEASTTPSVPVQEEPTPTPEPPKEKSQLDRLTKRSFAHKRVPGTHDYKLGAIVEINGRDLVVKGRKQVDLFRRANNNDLHTFYAVSDYPTVQVGDRFWFIREDDGTWHISPNRNRLKELD